MKRYAVTATNPPFGKPGDPRLRQSYRFTPTQKTKVYDALYASGKEGLSRHEIAAQIGLAADRISFYLSELRRAGLILVKGDPTTISDQMSSKEASEICLLNLEKALALRIREQKGKSTPEQDKGFVLYSKAKELALRPGTDAEGTAAMRVALVQLIKLVY